MRDNFATDVSLNLVERLLIKEDPLTQVEQARLSALLCKVTKIEEWNEISKVLSSKHTYNVDEARRDVLLQTTAQVSTRTTTRILDKLEGPYAGELIKTILSGFPEEQITSYLEPRFLKHPEVLEWFTTLVDTVYIPNLQYVLKLALPMLPEDEWVATAKQLIIADWETTKLLPFGRRWWSVGDGLSQKQVLEILETVQTLLEGTTEMRRNALLKDLQTRKLLASTSSLETFRDALAGKSSLREYSSEIRSNPNVVEFIIMLLKECECKDTRMLLKRLGPIVGEKAFSQVVLTSVLSVEAKRDTLVEYAALTRFSILKDELVTPEFLGCCSMRHGLSAAQVASYIDAKGLTPSETENFIQLLDLPEMKSMRLADILVLVSSVS